MHRDSCMLIGEAAARAGLGEMMAPTGHHVMLDDPQLLADVLQGAV